MWRLLDSINLWIHHKDGDGDGVGHQENHEDEAPEGLLLIEEDEDDVFEYKWVNNGKVTRVEQDFCLLDGQRYWQLDGEGDGDGAGRSGWRPRVHDDVEYKMRRKKPEGPWTVLEVHKAVDEAQGNGLVCTDLVLCWYNSDMLYR